MFDIFRNTNNNNKINEPIKHVFLLNISLLNLAVKELQVHVFILKMQNCSLDLF